ncbi:MAG: pyridoxal phosphate-dependent aminotransferase [Candidatus Bipolaricaulota bacterium]|nr:MAG: pyridoxal phosphate-dependent aminotransferase [Candidatus Bipolaricaulota bacterium]
MPDLSNRCATLKGSPIRRLVPLATAAKKRGIHVYHLNIGQPDIPTPKAFMDGVRTAAIDVLSYSPSPGIADTIEAFRGFYADMGIELSSDELRVTIGGSEAFVFALQTTCDAGTEILVPEPFYPNYMGHAIVNGLRIVPITTRIEDGFHLPPKEEIEGLITDRTRAILFSNPANPTGVGYTREELEGLVELALKHDLYVVSDEPYRELMYEGHAVSILEFPELAQHAILVDSISKRMSACGARIGCVATRNAELMASIDKLCQIRLSAPSFAQYGLVAFLRDPGYRDVIASMKDKFHARRDVLFDALQSLPGVVCRKPEGAFYIMVRLPGVDDSEDFVKFMLNEFELDGETVMVAPGAGFYATAGKGHDEVRMAYVLEEEKLRRAVEVLRAGLEAYVAQCERVSAAAG